MRNSPRRRLCATAIFATALLLGSAGMLAGPAPEKPAESSTRPLVVEMRIDGMVDPILATYINSGLEDAANRKASLVLITMDTPGGLSDSMRDIITHILQSPVPVAVYVSPTGSRGASAGFYILLAADIAAMAPATHTGSASPVLAIGGFVPVQLDETMRRKITNDATAFLRSYAVKRGRNVPLAETAVTEAKAFTEKESLDGRLIDLLANSVDDLLSQLNRRTVTRFDGTRVELHLANPLRVPFELSARQRFLTRIVQPDIFFVLFILGVLGLYTEFTHPGLVAPGVIGGICLVLALFAMHILPINIAGVLLILLALALFILEAKFTSHGILAIGGIVAMFLGAIFLIRSPLTGAGVSLSVALAVTLPFAGITVFLMRLVLRSRKWRPSTGPEELVGLTGIVTSPLALALGGGTVAEGMIRVHGELWRAASRVPVAEGQSVRVVRVDGLTLHVEPAESQPRSGS